ncbi:peptidylprolyl isomerase roc1, putative [Ichthyophthirius multifiliis]|uniref:peptidylprolyl isomerase n=1 Tax=Ichthyophthirius multifiliis TaxID=5932 RepID=G0QL59_ICHMU|nr:peptidylprolyl isomerase roc1, putative [Ichthyophthirius multifiliis]EGR34047.1 peptidylprolyl isomerase roc1, putative [Ichthyophthirius multifiliis]|eukprot:XP_004039351.1 peptidylprolyl isomerase roc1, putative [Ichthyophthirius multifiliis]
MIGSKPSGRIILELYTDLTPKTAENFRGLCTNDYGSTGLGGKTSQLSYENSKIHRIVENFCIQGGDITNGDGTGGLSIYGKYFDDEDFSRRHACAGQLSMANNGRNTNNSQFFITLKAAPHLDGKHVVFGQVIDGMDVVRQIAKVPVDINERPKLPVVIKQCGQIGDKRAFLKEDPFAKQKYEEIQKRKVEAEQLRRQGIDPEEYYAKQKDQDISIEEKKGKEMENALKKLKEKIEILKEEKNVEIPQVDIVNSKISEKNFGWNVFNSDSLYKAQEKRWKNLNFNEELYKEQMQNPQKAYEVSEEALNKLAQEIEEYRRRAYDRDQDVDFIDERNKNFNSKLKRHFSEYTRDIKANLERGSAI